VNPERWQRVKRILDSALEMPLDERTAYIEKAAGGDQSLCAEAKSLIAYQSTAADFMQSHALGTAGKNLVSDPARSLTGKKLGHYVIQDKLGAGGMGEVYLAKDLALGRHAAIKLLAPGFPSGYLSRLTQEAEAAVRLQHPGIATFYESGKDGAIEYIAMEYVPGETLRSRLLRGPLGVDAAVALAIGLLEALAHAHAAGILHRDIKPENIMFANGDLPKLLDFGLAIQLSLTDTEETRSAIQGVVAGTLGYMSPEQVRGESDLDGRSDIFSLGAVLYETLSGKPAFPGITPADRLASVLYKNPEPLESLGFSSAVSRMIQRSLEKDRDSRFPSAAAFLREALSLSDAPIQSGIPNTLAIMDFRNLNSDSADDWLGTGLAESLMADLAKLPGLKIAPRDRIANASRASGAETPDSLSIAQSLGCRWVLDGSFQRLATKIHINARLTEVATLNIAATEQLDGSIQQIFAMQDRLSSSVANTLQIQVSSAGAGVRPVLSAYEYYNRGRQLFLGYKKGGFERAASLYQEAIEVDPSYALAYAGLSAISAMRWTFTNNQGDLDIAKQYARRAIELDPSLGEPHIWLGYALFRSGQPKEALAEEQKARILDSSSSMSPYFEGLVLKELGRLDEAILSEQDALKIDPQWIPSWMLLGDLYLLVDRSTESLWCLQRCVQLERNAKSYQGTESGAMLAEVHRRMGSIAAAKAACLACLDEIEAADNMYRDHHRANCLNILGRCALTEGDLQAAAAAFHQTVTQIRGRNKTSAAGFIISRALAGEACSTQNPNLLDEACFIFRNRTEWNFATGIGNLEGDTAVDIGMAAAALGRIAEAKEWYEYARSQVVSGFRLGELEKAITEKNTGVRRQESE
jgi:eukaryotic-like serine/threonine-protein kinase